MGRGRRAAGVGAHDQRTALRRPTPQAEQDPGAGAHRVAGGPHHLVHRAESAGRLGHRRRCGSGRRHGHRRGRGRAVRHQRLGHDLQGRVGQPDHARQAGAALRDRRRGDPGGSTPRCTAAPATCPTWPSTNSMRCGSSGRSLPTSIGRRWSPAQPNPPTSRSTTQPMRAHPPGDRGGRLLPGHRGAPRWRHRPRSWAFRRSNTDHPAPFVDLGAEAVGVGPVSPLPSTVLEVQIEAGQQVSDGDLLVTLDAGD